MLLSLEILTSILGTGLPILVELISLVNYVMFLCQMTLLRWLNFLFQSQTVILSPALLDLFISFDTSICSTMAFPWEILIMLLSQFPLTFHQIHNRMPHFIT